MDTTMPRSALKHRAINTAQSLPPVAIRASRTQPEQIHTAYAISTHDQTGVWAWPFGAGMAITLVILLIGHFIGLPTW